MVETEENTDLSISREIRTVSYTHLDVYKRQLIDKLIDASQAGVKVELIVRGICCVKPQVEGATENITVISCLLYTSRCV